MRRAVSKLMPFKHRAPHDDLLYRVDSAAVEDFYILLDLPHKLWLPGEEILGLVILISTRNLANIVISFSLLGQVRVNGLPHLKLRPVKHTLFHHNIQIYGPDPNSPPSEFSNGLYKGEHRFPFIVKLPKKRVFTSIDFGKGAIEYVLKTQLRLADSPEEAPAILAKARSLSRLSAPTFSAEKPVTLVSPIDVSALAPPKPKRLIIKDPRRKLLQSLASTITTFLTTSTNSDSESAQIATPMLNHSLGELQPHAIRVLMETPHRGYLRGERIPIKLTINHLKQIQDSKGIIVTLVRVCRIDLGPENAFSSFRKDLQQLVIPLFVDPVLFFLEINTSLRVPADAFPTISGCPMVLFQYFIEVMLNLLGKTLNFDGPLEAKHEESTLGVSPASQNTYYAARSEFVNTDKFKRLKKFLQIATEIVIGTHRLERLESQNSPAAQAASPEVPSNVQISESPKFISPTSNSTPSASPGLMHPSTDGLQEPLSFSIPSYANGIPEVPTYDTLTAPTPQLDGLSEKERMQVHEAALFPLEPQFDESPESAGDNLAVGDSMTVGASGDVDVLELPQEEHWFDSMLHEGIGAEGLRDLVPDYANAANDRLLGRKEE